MSIRFHLSKAFTAAAIGAVLMGCSGGEGSGGATTGATATAKPSGTATATAATTATATATATASATASATATRPCPKDSAGDGTFKAPCEGKGPARMMEVTWTGKMDDKGPSFRVHNKSPLTILYGKVVVYFYDKAGKQLEVKDSAGKTAPSHACAGNLFAGIMKPDEKAVITFSCVGKSVVPEGAAAIEAEMQVVGFADNTEAKSDLYWKNTDLTPDARKKGAK